MIVGVVLIVAGAAVGGMFFGKSQPGAAGDSGPMDMGSEIMADASGDHGGGGDASGGGDHGAPAAAGHGGGGAATTQASGGGLTYEMEKFTTNLSDDMSTFVQMKVELEAANGDGLGLIQQNLAPLRDATIMLLSSKTREEVQSLAGKERLKREMLTRYQGVLNSNKALRNLYITEFTVVRY
jgi:flagellar FliL protein